VPEINTPEREVKVRVLTSQDAFYSANRPVEVTLIQGKTSDSLTLSFREAITLADKINLLRRGR
jgi:hypothetical protein